ncbi:helix-turn-helix domain-containing protein [Nocardia sp. NPDC052316]|uniref:helix-turn-helix domain-containing protein n=1 Tax=Nocardia sp. NPDC052316 TaxID=3364329 RepID=UPI0037C64B2A
MRVLDTSKVEPGNRTDLVVAAIQQMSAPSDIVMVDREAEVSGLIDVWKIGSVELGQICTGGYNVSRGARRIRVNPAPNLMLFVSPSSSIRWSQYDDIDEIVPGRVYVADLNRPLRADWQGGKVLTLQVPLDSIKMSSVSIRRAARRLPVSPLQKIIARHIAVVASEADLLETDPSSSYMGDALVEMVHAMIISDASRNCDGAALPSDILIAQVRDYIRLNIADPDLGPAGIASAHHISVRYLYKLCAEANFSLEQCIIDERLRIARRKLADRAQQYRTIAFIAHEIGFKSASHFSRRFRAAVGMTPREWRQRALWESPMHSRAAMDHQPSSFG